jgi:hypothetical protein
MITYWQESMLRIIHSLESGIAVGWTGSGVQECTPVPVRAKNGVRQIWTRIADLQNHLLAFPSEGNIPFWAISCKFTRGDTKGKNWKPTL